MWFVYIIQCKDGSFYTGITDNLERRFSEHRNKKGGHYTSSHGAKRLLYSEKFDTKSEALKRERQIKGWRREKKLKLMNHNL
jgi:putative endonuclease